jgi:hypothetical protein
MLGIMFLIKPFEIVYARLKIPAVPLKAGQGISQM